MTVLQNCHHNIIESRIDFISNQNQNIPVILIFVAYTFPLLRSLFGLDKIDMFFIKDDTIMISRLLCDQF